MPSPGATITHGYPFDDRTTARVPQRGEEGSTIHGPGFVGGDAVQMPGDDTGTVGRQFAIPRRARRISWRAGRAATVQPTPASEPASAVSRLIEASGIGAQVGRLRVSYSAS